MRTVPRLAFFVLAAACWLAAGPGGETTRALLACSHAAMHHMSGRHHSAAGDAPCFCDQMTGGLDLAVSTAVPTAPVAAPAVAVPVGIAMYQSVSPLPASPSFAPVPPPPNGVG